MALTKWQRKELLPFGAQKEVAEAEGCDPSVVSRVVNGTGYLFYDAKRVRRIEERLAKKMNVDVEEAFGPAPASVHTPADGAIPA